MHYDLIKKLFIFLKTNILISHQIIYYKQLDSKLRKNFGSTKINLKRKFIVLSASAAKDERLGSFENKLNH